MESTLLTTSLKDYKTSIDELRASLLNLNKDSEEYRKTVEEITERQKNYDEALAIGKKNIDGAEGSYNALVRQMKILKDEWRATNDEARRNELGTAINDINNQLKNFDASIGNHQRNVGEYEIATKSLRQELKDLTQQIAQGLASGLKTTDPEIQALTKRAGELKDAMADANAMINVAASDVGGFVQALDLAKTAMAGLSAAQGLARLFGEENGQMKELVKTMQQMQALQTTLNGLQQLQTSLVDRGSATYRLYNKVLSVFNRTKKTEATTTKEVTVAEKADATATDIDTTAKVKNTVATTAWNVALKMVKATLVSLGIGAILIVLGELLAHINDITKAIGKLVGWLGKVTGISKVFGAIKDGIGGAVSAVGDMLGVTEKMTEAEKALAEATQNVDKAMKDNESNIAKERAELDKTIVTLQNFNGTKKQEKEMIEDLNKKYGDILGTYSSKEKWMSVLVSKGRAYIDYLMKEAQATAMAAEAGRLYVEWRKAVADGATGDEQMTAYGKWQKVLDEAKRLQEEQIKISAGLSAGSENITTGNSKTKTSSKTNTEKVDTELLKNLKADLAKRKEYLDNYYAYEKAKGEDAVADEKDKYKDIYDAEKDYYAKAKALLTDKLSDSKLSAKQRAQYEKELADLERGFTNDTWKYVIEKEKQRTEEKKNETEKRKKIAEEELNADLHSLDREEKTMLRGVDNNDEIKALEQTFNIEKYFIEERILLYKQLRDAYAEGSEEYKKYNEKIIEEQENLEDKTATFNTNMAKANAEYKDNTIRNYLDAADAIGALLGSISDFYQSQIDLQVKQGKISEKEAKKEFERLKKIQIAEAIISTIAGAIGAYMNDVKTIKPAWLGIAVGIADAATVTAAGMAQVQKIKSTQYGSSNGSGGSSGGIMSAKVAPLIDTQDVVAMQTPNVNATNLQDQRVYVVESDIANVGHKVEVRESETTF